MKKSGPSSFSNSLSTLSVTNKPDISNSKTGLRNAAGGILSVLMPNRSGRLLRSRTVRRLQRKVRINMNNRPATAPVVRSRAGDDVEEYAIPTPVEQNSETLKIVHVSTEFLDQIARALHKDEDCRKARQLYQDCKRRLATLTRRLQYFQIQTVEILDWMKYRRAQLLDEDELTEEEVTELEKLPARLEAYNEQLSNIEEALRSVEIQGVDFRTRLDKIIVDHEELNEVVLKQLRSLLATRKEPVSMAEGNIELIFPIDESLMKIIENDCDNFVEYTSGKTPACCGKFPRRPTSDWHLHCVELELQRERCREAQALLAGLEASDNGASSNNNSVLDQQRAEVASAERALADAIEGVRYAGLPCRSNGSLLQSDCDFSNVISTYTFEDHHGNAKDADLSQKEIEQHLAHCRNLTENWLSCTAFDMDPEQVGPITPCTPGTPGFLTDLVEVEAGDSISNVTSPHVPESDWSSGCEGSCCRGNRRQEIEKAEDSLRLYKDKASISSASLPTPQRRAWSC